MKREPSFSQRLKSGATKEELMKFYAISEAQYEKAIVCLDRIEAAKNETTTQKQKKGVTK